MKRWSPPAGARGTFMKNRLVFAIVAVAVIGAAVWYFRGGGVPPASVALIDLYPEAEKRSLLPLDEAYALLDVTIGGDARRAIAMHPPSRLIFKNITLPRDAWLRVRVALRPEVWERKEGDGALFRVGVSDGRTYEDLVRQHVDPINTPGDRRWIPLEVDLSAWGGLTVDLVFNTETTMPGRPDNAVNDWAVWGAPEIYVQR